MEKSDRHAKLLRSVCRFAVFTLCSVGIGSLTLLLAACAGDLLPHRAMLLSYFSNGTLLLLDLLPAVLLAWFFCCVFGRYWCGILASGLICLGLSLANYYKIMLRGDSVLPSDLALLRTAGGIASRYHFELTGPVLFSLAAFLAALALTVFFLRGRISRRTRLLGSLLCLLAMLGAYRLLYLNESVYAKTANNALINPWSATEVVISRGFTLSFLHAIPDSLPHPPEGYHEADALALLAQYEDAAIPDARKVSVIGVMLEAFCDLTDFSPLADEDAVQAVYAPWHALQKDAVSGELITDIFAGGTVQSEWQFLTGASRFDAFRTDTDSYVRYFANQGYSTHYAHPGYQWFYDRRNVVGYLGFGESIFSETGFADLVDPVTAAWHSDRQLTGLLLEDFLAHRGEPRFSFAVSYQNHGPYDDSPAAKRIVSAASGLSEDSRNILDNYLCGIEESIACYTALLQQLDAQDEPVVCILFGDHKPWLGNNDSVYAELGVNFDTGTIEGLRSYYATPYLIWANRAARQVLGNDFIGSGATVSPCFLMTELFDLCGWTGPGFLQLSREMRTVSPLLHTSGLFWQNGTLTDTLSTDDRAFYLRYLGAQYYREKNYGK